jgi:hypothetical protein
MGTDISGWVEVLSMPASSTYRRAAHWNAAIDVGRLIERNYDMFGCLFGVTNYAHFRPIAANRGLPEGPSLTVEQEVSQLQGAAETQLIGLTWVTWPELKAIDWDESAEHADARLHMYARDSDGQLTYRAKAAWSPALQQITGLSSENAMRHPPVFPDGATWEFDGILYRAERLKRRYILTRDWKMLFAIMGTLAEYFGDDGVRLVVWFDR